MSDWTRAPGAGNVGVMDTWSPPSRTPLYDSLSEGGKAHVAMCGATPLEVEHALRQLATSLAARFVATAILGELWRGHDPGDEDDGPEAAR